MKWEYKLLRLDAGRESSELDEAMNEVDEFEWELVGIMHHAGEEKDSYYTAVFKRQTERKLSGTRHKEARRVLNAPS